MNEIIIVDEALKDRNIAMKKLYKDLLKQRLKSISEAKRENIKRGKIEGINLAIDLIKVKDFSKFIPLGHTDVLLSIIDDLLERKKEILKEEKK